jgi:esterase/lipase superfamily enzyme
MYMVSCRKGFDSNLLFGAENQYRNYTNPQDPDVFTEITKTKILDAATDKHVLVLVHGFNNPMPNVLKSYWEVAKGLDDQGLTGVGKYGLIIGFTWPGNKYGIGYFGAVPKANKSGASLRELITDLRGVSHSVDIQTHSLGARVALKALADPKKAFVDNLLMTAAAIDNDLLEPGQDFFAAMNSVNRCFTYHSKNDPVLKKGFWIGDILDGLHPALGLKGPRSKPVTLQETPNVYVVDCSARITSHGGYRKEVKYYEHWIDVLAGGPMHNYDELG